jgi:excisionase family DNA binding protein
VDDREHAREDPVSAADSAEPAKTRTEFLTVKQTAEYLNVSASIVYRLCIAKRLSHYKFGGGAIRISRTELMEFVRKCRVEERGERYPELVEHSRDQTQVRVYKHLDLREEHSCGAMTKAGTPCTLRTKEGRCHLHRRSEQESKRERGERADDPAFGLWTV